MSKATEYAIVPGEGINPGSQEIHPRIKDFPQLRWDRREDFDAITVEMSHDLACRLKDAGYLLSPDPREIALPKPRKKKTTKDLEEG